MAGSGSGSLLGIEDGKEAVEELKKHFATVPRWEFEIPLQEGLNGVVVRIKKRRLFGGVQRLAVKRALGEDEEDTLRNEIRWFKRLRGAEHVAKLVAASDDISNRDRKDNNDDDDDDEDDDGGDDDDDDDDDEEEDNNDKSIKANENSIWKRKPLYIMLKRLLFRRMDYYLVGLTGPVLVMEYLDNGTFRRLMERAKTHDIHLPNRLIWSFFLCRLAYPIGAGERDRTRLETIPNDGRKPSTVRHGDLHLGNIMIGDPGGRFPEHAVVPAAKFIDFGLTLETPAGLVNNMLKISTRMLDLIARDEVDATRNRSMYNGLETNATEILPAGNGAKYPHLDPDLRDFLARCLARQPKDRPGLDEMLDVTEKAQAKTAGSFPAPQQARETDEALRDVVRRLIYNAETNNANNT